MNTYIGTLGFIYNGSAAELYGLNGDFDYCPSGDDALPRPRLGYELLVLPDVSMLGYLAGRRWGAVAYDVGHWYGWSAACIAAGIGGFAAPALHVGLVWATHIVLDRAIGAGFKSREGFRSNHLGVLAPARRPCPAEDRVPTGLGATADVGLVEAATAS